MSNDDTPQQQISHRLGQSVRKTIQPTIAFEDDLKEAGDPHALAPKIGHAVANPPIVAPVPAPVPTRTAEDIAVAQKPIDDRVLSLRLLPYAILALSIIGCLALLANASEFAQSALPRSSQIIGFVTMCLPVLCVPVLLFGIKKVAVLLATAILTINYVAGLVEIVMLFLNDTGNSIFNGLPAVALVYVFFACWCGYAFKEVLERT